MRVFNVKISNTQEYTKPIYNSYKDNFNNILNSNIDDIISKIVFIKPKPK